jgi:hypothetical protein
MIVMHWKKISKTSGETITVVTFLPTFFLFFRKQGSLPEKLPQRPPGIMNSNTIILPEVPSNRKSFLKKYVKIASRLFSQIDVAKPLTLDLKNNGGGKPQALIAALLPILSFAPSSVLTYVKTKDHQFKKDIVKEKRPRKKERNMHQSGHERERNNVSSIHCEIVFFTT